MTDETFADEVVTALWGAIGKGDWHDVRDRILPNLAAAGLVVIPKSEDGMTTEDLYVTDGVNRDALVTLAQRTAAFFGRDQRLHVHPAGERCNDRCETVTA